MIPFRRSRATVRRANPAVRRNWLATGPSFPFLAVVFTRIYVQFAALASVAIVTANAALAQASGPDPVVEMGEITVIASQFPIGFQKGAVLGSLEVVTTPGSAADLNRAIQTLPGIQFVDEGNALFVRGGDSSETTTLINGVVYPVAQRLDAPAGTFVGAVDPFQTRQINFLAGGFGARYGDTLSGVVDIETLDPPLASGAKTNVGVGALSGSVAVALSPRVGFRLAAAHSDVAPLFDLNGSNRDYPRPPVSDSASADVGWVYAPGAEIKAFGLAQTNAFSLRVSEPDFRGVFSERIVNRFGTVSWADQYGFWRPAIDCGGGSLTRCETITGGKIATAADHRQFSARLGCDASDRLLISGGVNVTWEESTFTKTADGIPVFAGYAGDARWGAFVEADALPLPHWRVIAGIRTDHSRLTDRSTVDPRLSVAWEPLRAVGLSLAGGGYHQVPNDYALMAGAGSNRTLPAMGAKHGIAALQIGRGQRFARLELYVKRCTDLVALDREYRPVAGGGGSARGADLMFKTNLPGVVRARLTCSLVSARCTDPDSGQMAFAPFDVRYTTTLLLERTIARWQTGLALHVADGRRFTPVIGANLTVPEAYAPVYGAPFSERLPGFQRLDFSASRYWRLNDRVALVTYLSINNALNRANVYAYEYSQWLEIAGEAGDGLSAVELINTQKPDLVFLDIHLPELSGLDVLKRLVCEPLVIFTTAYDRHAIAAFELAALDYILKPFGRARLQQALEAKRLDRIFVRDGARIVPMSAGEIERIQADGDYAAVHARGRRFLVNLPLADFEERLDPQRFLRIHRSHLVNLDHVAALEPADNAQLLVRMKDGEKILASRSASKRLRDTTL